MSTIENEFYKRIETYLNKHDLNTKYQLIAEPDLRLYVPIHVRSLTRPDFLITKGGYAYMIIEVFNRKKQTFKDDQALLEYKNDVNNTGADYFIITDLNSVMIYDQKNGNYSENEFESIYQLFDELNQIEIDLLKLAVAEQIRKIVQESDFDEETLPWLGPTVKQVINNVNLINEISYNKEGRFFHFSSSENAGLDDFEHKFFRSLLDPVTEGTVCRYTGLDTAFHTILNKSYRIGSHLSMNDRGEMDYVDKYIGTFYKPLNQLSLSEIQKMNKSYISSCTEDSNQDDLTMYRLYGEDSKGICLCFSVSNSHHSNMLISRISYGRNRYSHPELDLIKTIVSSISSVVLSRFRFLYLDIWKHFFKSSDYALEKEVRLLYIENNLPRPRDIGWVITNPDRILSKYVLFDLDEVDFPLKLNKIILGPNLPEVQLNARQFEVLLAERGLSHIKVEHSEIESYRKS